MTMKTFNQFITEVYDPEVQGRSQIRKTGEGGRVGRDRRKSEPERRRMKAVGGGKMEPVSYKDRKDIGSQKQRSTKEQQPTKERGSSEVKQTNFRFNPSFFALTSASRPRKSPFFKRTAQPIPASYGL